MRRRTTRGAASALALLALPAGQATAGADYDVRPGATARHTDGTPRAEPSGRVQKSEFLRIGGRVVNVCGDHPCYADGYTGP